MGLSGILKWQVLALVAVNIVAVALLATGLKQLHERATHEAEIRSQNIALAVELQLSGEFSKLDLSLRTVATELDHLLSLGEKEREPLVKALIARQKAALPEAEGWTISDVEGNVLFHAGEREPRSFSVADREYFRDLKSGRAAGLLISKPITSQLTGNQVLIFARALSDAQGSFSGVLVVALPLNSLKQMLSGFELGKRGVIFLRDADLGLIARIANDPAENTLAVGDSRISPTLRALVTSGKTQATYHATSPASDIERIFSFRILSSAPILAGVGISEEDFLEDWRVTAWSLSAICFLLLAACDAAIVLLYRQWRMQQRSASALREGNARLKQSLQQLQERDDALVAAQQAGKLGTYTLNVASGEWTCTPQLDAIFGIDESYPHTLEGWRQLMHPDDRGAMSEYFRDKVVGQRSVFDREYRIVRPCDGRVVWVHGLGRLDFDAEGLPALMSGTIQDVSTRRAADERLHLVEEVFLNATEGILITDRQGAILETNLAFKRITGYSAEEARGQNPRILQSGAQDAAFYRGLWNDLLTTGRWDGELINRRKDGATYVQYSRIFAIYDSLGEIVRFTSVFSDVTELKESQRRLEHLAYYDELTGFPNRALFAERMREAMIECKLQRPRQLAICCLDLDGFKDINDRLGHDVGDQLLIQVAHRLQACTREDETVARLGGDEYLVLLVDPDGDRDMNEAVAGLLQTGSQPYVLGKYLAPVTLSIGVSLYAAGDAEEPDALLRQAHEAMYDAKRFGKNRIHYFDLESERHLREHHALHDRLVEALARGEFRLHYQPKVCLRTGKLTGVEALLRWQHPERGLLPPQEFLPTIEATELTLPLGEWILHEALKQHCRWLAHGLVVSISVNIFGLHLQRADFVERLGALLGSYPDVAPGILELEVLETTALENLDEVTTRIRGCMQLGVMFSLDDFGTGYSSLTYLRQLPVNKVKIDRSFVREMLVNPDDQSIVESIIAMAHSLGRQVIAEGVETAEHGALLLQCGCDCAQGYGIARPMPPEQLTEWAAHWGMPAEWAAAIRTLEDRVTEQAVP